MDRTSLILSFAIFALFISNIYFSELSYFHPIEIIAINLLGLVSAIAFFFAYSQRGKQLSLGPKQASYLIAAIIVFFLIIGFQLVAVATFITLLGAYAIKLLSKRLKSYRLYIAAIVVIIITFLLAYGAVSGLRKPNWKGVDEAAYNYYAPYLLLRGQNPYKASMMPILLEHNITPTYYMNGTIETAYDYPALSFLVVLPIGLLNLRNFLIFIAIVALIATVATIIVYRKSNYNRLVLIPLTAWLLVTYLFMGTIGQYLACSIFLLLAYIERKNIIIAGILMGLAASTIQLAWFAIPFFLVLTYREHGGKALAKSICLVIATFLIINGYFIIVSPKYFTNDMLQIFTGSSKLLLAGTNIMQFFVKSYGVALWYPTVISILALAVMLALFYFYTSTLKPLIALVPAYIFMLTWRNFLMYSLAFVPLIIVICYESDKKGVKDALKDKKYITLAFALLAIIAVALAIYAHYIYKTDNTLVINSATPSIERISASQYDFNGIAINITNNANHYENVSIFLINRYPIRDGVFLPNSIMPIPPHSSMLYNLNYVVTNVSYNTSVYVMPFSSDYITSRQFNISIQANSSKG